MSLKGLAMTFFLLFLGDPNAKQLLRGSRDSVPRKQLRRARLHGSLSVAYTPGAHKVNFMQPVGPRAI